MANSTRRDGDISKLHPAIRNKVTAIQKQLNDEGIDFHVFEAFRTPERQAKLKAKRPKVTWVGPWGSIHQYGLAVDFVLKINGQWSWDDQGAEAKHWDRMHELAKENGMTPLYNKKGQLIEKPHIQMIGVSSASLRKGNYPEGGDEQWAERLGDLIDNWEGTGAPPKPGIVPERPPLSPDILAEMEALHGDSDPVSPKTAPNDPRFQKIHAFVKRWEGGFVNHPDDKGGATNMGITIGTLAEWRGKEVSVEDVRDLSRAEADEIFRARYYSVARCGEMPERMAAVVYNCAVLSGPKRSIKFVQQAFNTLGLTVDGNKLEVDGVLGRLTMGVLQKTDASVLSSAFMDQQEEYLRGLDTFHAFGRGWMNRMAALREFVSTLPQGAGIRPTTRMNINNASKIDFEDLIATITKAADGKPPLTPINAALGQTVGRALNGKKSVSGIIGLVLTTFLPSFGLSGDIVNFLTNNTDTLVTLFSLVTGWGMFGKLDKAIRLVGMAKNRL